MHKESRKKGVAKRHNNLNELCIICNKLSKTGLNLTQIKVKSLLDKSNRVLKKQKKVTLNSRKQQLLQVLVNYVYTDKWKSGNAVVFAGNKRIAEDLGISERSVRRHLNELEKEGWLLRQYDDYNHRNNKNYGINLLPLGAKIEKIAEELEKIKRQEKEKKEAKKIEQKDRSKTKALTTGVVTNDHHNNYINKPINNVNNEKVIKSKINLIKKLVQTSTILEKTLTDEEKESLDSYKIIRAIELLRLRHIPELNPIIWKRGLEKHGVYAEAAAIITLEKNKIENKAAYLSGILKKDDITQSIWTSLEKIEQDQKKLKNLVAEPKEYKGIERQDKKALSFCVDLKPFQINQGNPALYKKWVEVVRIEKPRDRVAHWLNYCEQKEAI